MTTAFSSTLPTMTSLINSTTNSTSNGSICNDPATWSYDECYSIHTNIHIFSIVFPTVIGGLLLISGLLYLCTDGSGWTLVIPCLIVSPLVFAGAHVAAVGAIVWYLGIFVFWCMGGMWRHWVVPGWRGTWRGVKGVGMWCWYPVRERKEIRRRREDKRKVKEEKRVEDEKRELEEKRRKAGPVMIEATEV